MWCKIKLHIFSEPALAQCTAAQGGCIAGERPLNFVQVDRYTVFSDSVNIAELFQSDLSTQKSTPTKRLIRNGGLAKRLVITDP